MSKLKFRGPLALLIKEVYTNASSLFRTIFLIILPKVFSILEIGYFMTKIFHPNVSEKGEICVNTLKKDWNPAAWSLYNIL